MFIIKARFILIVLFSQFFISSIKAEPPGDSTQMHISWREISTGIWLSEVGLPDSSVVADSKLTLLKINPYLNDFKLLTASQHGRKTRTAEEWGSGFNVDVVFNAGMYSLKNHITSKGYLKNYNHKNNSRINPAYNIILAFNPKADSIVPFKMFDLACTDFTTISSKYNSMSQILRMVDCNGAPLSWDKRPGQKCSMIFIAQDNLDNLYLLFTRSPYTHNYMINILLSLPINAQIAGYLEGGPETSLFINTDSAKISKFGSFVSKTYENDLNDHFWNIPNVIGIRAKK